MAANVSERPPGGNRDLDGGHHRRRGSVRVVFAPGNGAGNGNGNGIPTVPARDVVNIPINNRVLAGIGPELRQDTTNPVPVMPSPAVWQEIKALALVDTGDLELELTRFR